MTKKKEPLESPDVVHEIGTIKRLTAATLIIVAVAVLLVLVSVAPAIIQLVGGGNPDTIQDYIGKHREEVKTVFEKEEGLAFSDLVLSIRREQTREVGDVRLRLDVIVTAEKKKPIATYDERVKVLKEKIDAILTDPPHGAKVRLILRSETVLD